MEHYCSLALRSTVSETRKEMPASRDTIRDTQEEKRRSRSAQNKITISTFIRRPERRVECWQYKGKRALEPGGDGGIQLFINGMPNQKGRATPYACADYCPLVQGCCCCPSPPGSPSTVRSPNVNAISGSKPNEPESNVCHKLSWSEDPMNPPKL